MPGPVRAHNDCPQTLTLLDDATSQLNEAKLAVNEAKARVSAAQDEMGAGEALLIGESVVMPSLVKVQRCDPPPSSTDIPYYQLWKEEWKQLNFDGIKKAWLKE